MTSKLRRSLAELGATTAKLHGEAGQSAGLPDVLVGYSCKLGLVEMKRNGRGPSPRQLIELRRFRPSLVVDVNVKAIEDGICPVRIYYINDDETQITLIRFDDKPSRLEIAAQHVIACLFTEIDWTALCGTTGSSGS